MRMAGEPENVARFDTYWASAPSVPASGNTHRSVGMPSERALPAEQMMSPAPCSTLSFEFTTLR